MKQRLRQDLNIGANLRLLRKKYQYSQPDITAKLQTYGVNISRSHYSRLETGELNVPVSVLVALQDIYDCPYSVFFHGLKEQLEQQGNKLPNE